MERKLSIDEYPIEETEDNDLVDPDRGLLLEMAFVPQGPAWIGCDPSVPDPFGDSCLDDELPFHQVYLSSFLIDRMEVSFLAYRLCVRAGVCRRSRINDDPYLSDNRQPVIGVNWAEADAYCRWRGKRLPTEAEWEKAARGPHGNIYSWGNRWDPDGGNWDELGVFDGFNTTAPVWAFYWIPSPYGVLNMTGNVWEWVSDYYDPNYYLNSPVTDPQGPPSGAWRILKGGAWKWDFWETKMRTYYRNAKPGLGSSDHVGFRCAKSL